MSSPDPTPRIVHARARGPGRRQAAQGTDIATYRARRDFEATPEPPAGEDAAASAGPIFVVQKHAASRLHWDFRLEHGGVLWSWAVPRGPSLDPADKRLAVHVEDHPREYADFQGTIPQGQYGAGTVETWDRGTWAPVGDPEAGLRQGELKFTLAGARLNGGFVLVRLKPRPKERAENWLLIKEHDAHERPGADAAALERPAKAKQPKVVQVGETVKVGDVGLTHPDRALWPGISKRALADYWLAVAEHALPEIARRPLALVRCPEGIAGEHFFQKHGGRGFSRLIRAAEAGGAPYLAIDDAPGLLACAQVSAIELHAWGATEADALHPDRLVFDLDPGEGIGMEDLVRTAREVKARAERHGLAAFCRTSGGRGLHVVCPLTPHADWDAARAWSRAFAEAMVADSPGRYVSKVSKDLREGHILIDWLRNGLGSTAIASFSPRARPGAAVATRLAWREVTARLDPARFDIHTVPARLARQRTDPWEGFAEAARPLPEGTP